MTQVNGYYVSFKLEDGGDVFIGIPFIIFDQACLANLLFVLDTNTGDIHKAHKLAYFQLIKQQK